MMEELIYVSKDTVNEAMLAIRRLQNALGIDLTDEDGYGYVYFALEKAIAEADR
jgi:hypothetical protein